MPLLSTVAIHLRPIDNIAVATRMIPANSELEIEGQAVSIPSTVDMGHKVAVRPIAKGEPILKFGQIIGFASQDVPVGGHVHVHNCKADNFERDYAYAEDVPPPLPAPKEYRTFMGFDRGADNPIICVTARATTSPSSARSIAARRRVNMSPSASAPAAF